MKQYFKALYTVLFITETSENYYNELQHDYQEIQQAFKTTINEVK